MSSIATPTEIDSFIDANSSRFLEELKELCSFSSIANHGNEALEPCRHWIEQKLRQHTDDVQTFQEGGAPTLFADIRGDSPRSLLLYCHYDVQPVDPIDLWDSPPFQASERDGRIFARGVADDKDDVMARLHAIETLRKVTGRVPVTLKFLCEGEEETGSPSFGKIVDRNADRLRADGCLWEASGFDSQGRPEIYFGARGLLYVDLRVRLLDFDQHSATASLYPSAAFYLVEAIASLRDRDMRIRIDGFYDDVVPPSEADRHMLGAIDAELEARRQLVGFDSLVGSPSPERAMEQLLFTPTCNVAGIEAGYNGPGSKTVLPAEARAKLDFRLIPNQDPTDILRKLRRHLDAHGFEKVEILPHSEGEMPARSDPESELGRTVVECEREMYGQEPVAWPFMAGTGPMHPIAHQLGIPTVAATGDTRPDKRIHAPNENIHAADYINNVKLHCRIFEAFANAR